MFRQAFLYDIVQLSDGGKFMPTPFSGRCEMRRKTEDRRISFVKAAGKLFVEQGLGSVTMEAIASKAGASKATLYGYFPSKEALFEAFVVEAGKGARQTFITASEAADLGDVLRRLGGAYLNLITRPEVIDINRLIIGEAGRQPELTRIFYENGPRNVIAAICEVLETLMARGLLKRTGVRQAGLYFKSLCDAGLVERQLWGLDGPPDEQTLTTAVADATEVFLAAFAENSCAVVAVTD